MKRIAFKVLALAVAFVVAAAAVEIAAVVFLTLRSKHYISARERLDALKNTFVDAATKPGGECRYIDTLFPHPYLGFVHHGNPPCGLPDANNIGLFGPDYPSERRTDRFVVLVTGGSVASQFMLPVDGGVSYLEQMMNAHYESPNGRPFLLLNGGDGAWKQPQQAVLFLLYADAVHAVVTLDGFNEHYSIGASERLEYPATNFAVVNPLLNRDYSDIVKQWMAGRIFGYAANNAILSRSQAAYIALELIDGYLRRPPKMVQRKTTVESMFALPQDWTPEHRVAWAENQYAKYFRSIDLLAAEQHVLSAHFIQPVPVIDKVLTDSERMRVGTDVGYAGMYQHMTNSLLALSSQGSQVFSLLDVYKDVREPIYADHIHAIRESGNRSLGYKIMAQRIAETLARAWHLRTKS
jgi:hypothetical protein